jgi:hypothetical protein
MYGLLEASLSHLEDLCNDILGVYCIECLALCAEMVNKARLERREIVPEGVPRHRCLNCLFVKLEICIDWDPNVAKQKDN